MLAEDSTVPPTPQDEDKRVKAVSRSRGSGPWVLRALLPQPLSTGSTSAVLRPVKDEIKTTLVGPISKVPRLPFPTSETRGVAYWRKPCTPGKTPPGCAAPHSPGWRPHLGGLLRALKPCAEPRKEEDLFREPV